MVLRSQPAHISLTARRAQQPDRHPPSRPHHPDQRNRREITTPELTNNPPYQLAGHSGARHRARPKPAQHDNAAPNPEACRANHEEHGQYDRARAWRRCCRVMQVSRDTLGTKAPVWPRRAGRPQAQPTRRTPHPPSFPAAVYRADRAKPRGRQPPPWAATGVSTAAAHALERDDSQPSVGRMFWLRLKRFCGSYRCLMP